MGLTYATGNRGAYHVHGYVTSLEILGIPEMSDNLATEGKAGWVKIFQDLTAAVDAAGIFSEEARVFPIFVCRSRHGQNSG